MLLNIFLIIISSFAIAVVCAMCLQKDIFIKLLFLNIATSIGALFICCLGSYKANSSYIDIALIYFLLSVIANGAYLKYFSRKNQKEIDEKT